MEIAAVTQIIAVLLFVLNFNCAPLFFSRTSAKALSLADLCISGIAVFFCHFSARAAFSVILSAILALAERRPPYSDLVIDEASPSIEKRPS